ncbi:MAG: hypothetical protein M3457_15280, partial [Chloroflexota bacterium]|nr:hypothetical protein [Chloroflexota bacterium]
MLDLDHATRDQLIGLVLEQRDALAERDRQLAVLPAEPAEGRRVITQRTAQVGALQAPRPGDDPPPGAPKGMPGLTPPEP